jgi:energy-coupling factor transporter ATP-binding protein EcfA2
MDFFATVKGDGPVSDAEGLGVFELLAPVLIAAPDDPEALGAATNTIARMSRESLASVLLDWWFATATGDAPPLGLAFHLPDSIQPPLRTAMDSVTALAHSGLRLPPAQWVKQAQHLGRLVPDLDEALVLDSYGKSKLPGEREAWAWLQDELSTTIDALRSSRKASSFELDLRDYKSRMSSAGIDENSRRWDEMIKRARQCVDRVNEVVTVQEQVEPWIPRDLPTTLDALPQEVAALGPIAQLLLAPLLADVELPDGDATSTADAIDDACRGRTPVELSWLASLCDGWLAATGVEVPGLTAVVSRRQRIQAQIDALRGAGIDADEVELMFLDHDLDTAEQVLESIEADRKTSRRSEAITASLQQLDARAAAGPLPEDWAERLAAAQDAAGAGDLDTAERLRQSLDADLKASRRSEIVEELRDVFEMLQALRAPVSLVAELDGHLTKLDEHDDKAPDAALLQRSQERLDSIRQQRVLEGDRRVKEAHDLLDVERDLIPSDTLPLLELRLAEAEQLLAAGETMAALDLLGALVEDINNQRVHRWTAAEGEDPLVGHVINYCTQQVHFDPDDVRRLYVAAKTKPFVILAGLTGSGKSTIARLFAAALGADAHNGRFQRVAVRPDWIDQSEVLGTVNPLSNRFEPGWLATTARQCERNPDQIHVVLLDEMNLAPVEQYLAEYLSALEEARSGSERTVLPLYSSGMTPDNAADWPSSLAFPLNLLVIGTVNVDETTRVLSDRVLDRANVLQLSVAVSDAHHRPVSRSVQPWYVPFPEWDLICDLRPDDGHHEFLVEVGELLQGCGIGVGQRAHIELERFVTNALAVLSAERALDLGVLQRIIPKIRGFKRDLADGLAELHELLESAACDRSAAVIAAWLDDRVSDDEFLDGTDARIGLVR